LDWHSGLTRAAVAQLLRSQSALAPDRALSGTIKHAFSSLLEFWFLSKSRGSAAGRLQRIDSGMRISRGYGPSSPVGTGRPSATRRTARMPRFAI